MNRVELSGWGNDKQNLPLIYQVASQINSFSRDIENKTFDKSKYIILFENIQNVLSSWVGCTYVGVKKDKDFEKAYQSFFLALYKWLLILRTVPYENIQNLVKDALYKGVVYRYISDIKEPNYNDIYVSWSTKEKIIYLEQKIGYPHTHITCNITGDYYGIDISVFGIGLENESEIVFPTIKSLITNIEYIKENDYGE